MKKFIEGSLYCAGTVIGFLALLGRTTEVITHSEFKSAGAISVLFLALGYGFMKMNNRESKQIK